MFYCFIHSTSTSPYTSMLGVQRILCNRHYVHEMIALNKKVKGTNDENKKIEDKIKHSGDNEDPTNQVIKE